MVDISSAIKNTISISLFNRGMAGKVFEEVKKTGAKVVMKNNTPECVLLSPAEYIQIMDALNDAQLAAIATERLQHFDQSKLIDGDTVLQNLGITEADLAGFDEVELE